MDLADTTARPPRELLSFPGLGLRTVLQARPFQCRMSDLSWKLEPASAPTAQTLFADTRRTVLRSFAKLPGLGVFACLHARPFQCSMSVLFEAKSPDWVE